MDLSIFVTYDKKESLLLSIAKSNQEIVENTHSKPQETLEFKMNKQKEPFSFDIPLELPEQWMMGVTSLEVYNTVYNITEKNNNFKILLRKDQIDVLGLDTELVKKVEYLYKTSDNKGISNIEKINKLIVDNYKKKRGLTQEDFDTLTELINLVNLENTKNNKGSLNIIIPDYNIFIDHVKIELTPGVYELTEINNAIKEKIIESKDYAPVDTETFKKLKQTKDQNLIFYIEYNIQADTISMKSILSSSNHIVFNSELNNLLAFTKTRYSEGTHRSEKPVMITTTDKVHLKCDCVDGSIVNGIREQILFSFNLSAPPGYKIIKEPNIILHKKINKTRLDSIQFFLEDSNHNPVDFNSETLTFTIQIIKI